MPTRDYIQQMEQAGYLIQPGFYSGAEVTQLIDTLGHHRVFSYEAEETDLLKQIPGLPTLLKGNTLSEIASAILGPGAKPLKAILLDKTNAANWVLDWHQDLKIAVKRKVFTPRYEKWSVAAGICQVEPPVDILKNMLAIRIHLDDCTNDNGAILAIAGTHHNILGQKDIIAVTANSTPTVCSAPRGSIMLMRPLLLHRSPASSSMLPRRIIHIEYTNAKLDGCLEWN